MHPHVCSKKLIHLKHNFLLSKWSKKRQSEQYIPVSAPIWSPLTQTINQHISPSTYIPIKIFQSTYTPIKYLNQNILINISQLKYPNQHIPIKIFQSTYIPIKYSNQNISTKLSPSKYPNQYIPSIYHNILINISSNLSQSARQFGDH